MAKKKSNTKRISRSEKTIQLMNETRHVIRFFEELSKDLKIPLVTTYKNSKLIMTIKGIAKLEIREIKGWQNVQ